MGCRGSGAATNNKKGIHVMDAVVQIEIGDDKLVLNRAFVSKRPSGDLIAIYFNDKYRDFLIGTPEDLLSFAEQIKNLAHVAEISRMARDAKPGRSYGMYTSVGDNIVASVVDYAIKNSISDYEVIAKMVLDIGKNRDVLVSEIYDTVVRENIYDALDRE